MPTIFKIRVWEDFDAVSPIVEYGVLCKYCGELYGQFRQKIHAERIEKKLEPMHLVNRHRLHKNFFFF